MFQASESEILAAVIRWGELVVARRAEGESAAAVAAAAMTASTTSSGGGIGVALPLPGSGSSGKRAGRRRGEGLVCDRSDITTNETDNFYIFT